MAASIYSIMFDMQHNLTDYAELLEGKIVVPLLTTQVFRTMISGWPWKLAQSLIKCSNPNGVARGQNVGIGVWPLFLMMFFWLIIWGRLYDKPSFYHLITDMSILIQNIEWLIMLLYQLYRLTKQARNNYECAHKHENMPLFL